MTTRRLHTPRLACLLGTIMTATACAHAADPEYRGTWLTTTANDAIATPADSAATMQRLREIGLNTVYVETWKNGYTQFPSDTLEAVVGVDRRPALVPQDPSDPPQRHARPGRDLLQETLIQAHRNGLIYIAWFEYGFMAAYKDTDNHLRRMKPDWLTQTRDGELVSDQNPFVWMNPLKPEVQDFLLNLVLEAVEKYDLDGVQLDDRIALPVTMGYDPYTTQLYAQEHGGRLPPDDPRDPAWVQWRADKVTEFAERFYRTLKEARPNLIVSISPAIYPWSLENYCCDWPRWAARGWMEEYVPQCYRRDYESFEPTWLQQLEHIGDRREDLIAGIRIVGVGPDTTWPDMKKKLDLVRRTGGGGHCHWFSRGVLEVYPDEITAYYDVAGQGRSPHPTRGLQWRPAPIVLHEAEPGHWRAEDVPAGAYRLIEQRGDVWTVARRLETGGGPFEHRPEGEVDGVELLVDRREATPPRHIRSSASRPEVKVPAHHSPATGSE